MEISTFYQNGDLSFGFNGGFSGQEFSGDTAMSKDRFEAIRLKLKPVDESQLNFSLKNSDVGKSLSKLQGNTQKAVKKVGVNAEKALDKFGDTKAGDVGKSIISTASLNYGKSDYVPETKAGQTAIRVTRGVGVAAAVMANSIVPGSGVIAAAIVPFLKKPKKIIDDAFGLDPDPNAPPLPADDSIFIDLQNPNKATTKQQLRNSIILASATGVAIVAIITIIIKKGFKK